MTFLWVTQLAFASKYFQPLTCCTATFRTVDNVMHNSFLATSVVVGSVHLASCFTALKLCVISCMYSTTFLLRSLWDSYCAQQVPWLLDWV